MCQSSTNKFNFPKFGNEKKNDEKDETTAWWAVVEAAESPAKGMCGVVLSCGILP